MDARSRCIFAGSFPLLATLLLSFTAPLANGQTGSITGIVEDEHGTAIPYASVTVKSLARGARTNVYGVYQITRVPAGIHTVSMRVMGYESGERTNVRIGEGEETRVDFKVKMVQLRVFMTGPGSMMPEAKPSRCWLPPKPAPVVNISSWKRVEYGEFSLLLPPDFHKRKGSEIDPEVLEFGSLTAPTRFSIYWGIYADPLGKSERYQRYATSSEWIGGKRAILMTAEWKERGDPRDFGCVVAGAWRDVTPDLNLTIQGNARDREGMTVLMAILRTVRFDWKRDGESLPVDEK